MEHFDDGQLTELMAKVFPGYQEFDIDSVTPSITGQDDVISFMIVCNEEASMDFIQTDEFSAEVTASVGLSRRRQGQELNLRFEFAFEFFQLQFFVTVESGEQQLHFAEVMMKADYFIVWLVDKDKHILKIIQVNWDREKNKDALEKILKS